MRVGDDTCAGDLLRLCGGRNVFAGRADRRDPCVSPDEVVAAAPEVVLLPDEPFAFGPADVATLAGLVCRRAETAEFSASTALWCRGTVRASRARSFVFARLAPSPR